jgi:hypothetical protein
MNKHYGKQLMAATVWMLAVTALLSGCGSGFSTSSSIAPCSTCGNSAAGGGGTGGGGSTPVAPKVNAKDYAGTLNGGGFTNTSVISIDIPKSEIVFRLPLLQNPFLDGTMLDIPVPQVPGARVGLDTLPDGRVAVVLRMPISTYLNGAKLLPPSKLPNGDAIPGVPDGELPSVAIDLNTLLKIKATLYLAPTVVGIYVNSPFDPFIRLTFPIRNDSNAILGYFSVVPAKVDSISGVSYQGGFFASFALPDDLARALNSLL